jgi:hypothetical protein
LNASPESSPQRSGLVILLLLCCAGIIALGVAAWSYSSHQRRYTEPPAAIAVMTPAERDYVTSIQVHLMVVQQAENYAHQRRVILQGQVVNAGARAVGELQFRVQFLGKLNEVVLREMPEVWAPTGQGLAAGEERSFEFTFEKVPQNWNGLPPTIGVNRLQLLP